jgi:hypothetical protein
VDLTAWLLRHTPPRPLVLTGTGGTAARLAAERAIRDRGWRPALSPAEANILVVAGEGLDPYAERVWRSMPAPRARLALTSPAEVPFEDAVAELGDVDRQRTHAAPQHHRSPATHGHHLAHGEHGHHMDGMEMPGGIPMADRAEDRDGLKLDQLHLPLGPALPLWPAGLIVHTRLQGDVIQQATVETLPSPGESFWTTASPAARRLDSCARLLALAGWTTAATTAQLLRDEALDGSPPSRLLEKWTRQVRRSRTLRWLLAGVGTTPTGDALSRLRGWLAPDPPVDSPQETRHLVDTLPTMLAGAELATARLAIASLDPDLDLLPHHHEAAITQNTEWTAAPPPATGYLPPSPPHHPEARHD